MNTIIYVDRNSKKKFLINSKIKKYEKITIHDKTFKSKNIEIKNKIKK